MDYNFTSSSVDAIVKFEKTLSKIKDGIFDDLGNFVRILNDKETTESAQQVREVLHTYLNDEINKMIVNFTGCMNKVSQMLSNSL